MTNETPTPTFYNLGIAPGILDQIEKLKFKTPTPIQYKSIPMAIEGKDVLGIAQTGTGKTLAFGIPTIQKLAQNPGRALVLVPTRELAIQVDDVLRRFGQPFRIGTVVLIGGMNIQPQLQLLRRDTTRILIATPGRLLDHLEQKSTHLQDMKVIVVDEADRMLDMGFAPQLQQIARYMPKERQTLFFSATMPDAIVKLATQYMKLPIRVEIAAAGTAPERIVQELFIVKQEAKRQVLAKLVQENQGSILIFSRTKISAKKITMFLRNLNHRVNEIHSNRSLGQRREALEGFKTGRYRILVATDIASRGIDVKGIELVINYDLPEDSENYVHRIGRTGRAGREGRAISLATPDQRAQVKDIERLIRGTLKMATHPEIQSENFFGGNAPALGQPGHPKFRSMLRRRGPSRGGFRGRR